jgi:hypothetical protein
MRLFAIQLRRALTAPFFLGLMLVFLAYNGLQIFFFCQQNKPAAEAVCEISAQHGVIFDAPFRDFLTPKAASSSADLTALYQSKFEKLANKDVSADEMIQSLKWDSTKLTQAERKRLAEAEAVLAVSGAAEKSAGLYADADFAGSAEQTIRENGMTGYAAELTRQSAALLDARAKEIQSDGEAQTLFFPGKTCGVHRFFYGTLLHDILFESAVLGVLLMLYLFGFEFGAKTDSLAYCTRRGRCLGFDQIGAAMLAGMLVPAVLLAASLPVFFANFDFSAFWNVPVASILNTDVSRNVSQLLTWNRMTMEEYLLASLGVLFGIQAVCCIFGCAAAVFSRKNVYLGFLVLALAGFAASLLPGLLPKNLFAFLLAANPLWAWQNCGLWFAYSEPLSCYPGYFVVLFASCGTLATALSATGILRFRRADL